MSHRVEFEQSLWKNGFKRVEKCKNYLGFALQKEQCSEGKEYGLTCNCFTYLR
jgi:hypothetical protein